LKPQKRINRPRLYYESGWVQSSFVPITYITLGSVYRDTADVTSCSRHETVREAVNCNNLKSSLCL